jgi:hypothetical protein
MTWIALADEAEQAFSLTGLDGDTQDHPVAGTGRHALLVRGSLVFEARLSSDGLPQELFNYRQGDGWLGALTLHTAPDGITLDIAQNGDVFHATVQHSDTGRSELVRITYSWDAPGRWARLAIERPEGCAANIVNIDNPQPMLVSDLHSLFIDQTKRHVSEDVLFIALSNQVEPIGPMPKLSTQTPIETANGYRQAGELQRGDLVRTDEGDLVPVLGVVHRNVPARGSFAPIRVCAPYFGLEQDILIAPDQRLVLRGTEVEKLFGKDAVLVPARHLVNGTAALPHLGLTTITYTQVLLPGHETMIAAGIATESLYIGRLRRKPAQLEASLLAGFDRNSLPEHGYTAFPVLPWFDAITLAAYQTA